MKGGQVAATIGPGVRLPARKPSRRLCAPASSALHTPAAQASPSACVGRHPAIVDRHGLQLDRPTPRAMSQAWMRSRRRSGRRPGSSGRAERHSYGVSRRVVEDGLHGVPGGRPGGERLGIGDHAAGAARAGSGSPTPSAWRDVANRPPRTGTGRPSLVGHRHREDRWRGGDHRSVGPVGRSGRVPRRRQWALLSARWTGWASPAWERWARPWPPTWRGPASR
jgi:hypothetical protein